MLPLAPPGHANARVVACLDEVGRGSACMDVVACAYIYDVNCVVSDDERKQLANVRDSKKISKKKRERLSVLLKKVALEYAFGSASHVEIDDINIGEATQLAMRRALEALSVDAELIVVDGNVFRGFRDVPCVIFPKADDKIFGVAAASILAKVERDAAVSEAAKAFPAYGWANNAGYLTPQHISALRIHGATSLHRKTFLRNIL